jgi:hypothetical protein
VSRSGSSATSRTPSSSPAPKRRRRPPNAYLVVVIPAGGDYHVGIYSPATGRLEGVGDEGELCPYLSSPPCASETEAAELAALVRELRISDLFSISVTPYEPPPLPVLAPPASLPWWRRLLLRLGL